MVARANQSSSLGALFGLHPAASAATKDASRAFRSGRVKWERPCGLVYPCACCVMVAPLGAANLKGARNTARKQIWRRRREAATARPSTRLRRSQPGARSQPVMASSDAAAAAVMDVDGEAPPPFVFEAPLYPASHKLSALLYEEVSNAEELRAALLSGDLPEFALLNADRVASTFHLLLAGSTALMHQRAGTLHVRTLHAELIYALAPGTSISEAFRVFGAGKGDTKVLAAFIDAPPGAVARVAAAVKGRPVQDITAHLNARPLSYERLSRFREVFKLGSGGRSQEQQKGKGEGKGKGQAPEEIGGEDEEDEEDEDLERTIVSRIAAKHVL